METTGENSGTLWHERHVGKEDKRERERWWRIRGKSGEGGGVYWGVLVFLYSCVCVCVRSMPPLGIHVIVIIVLKELIPLSQHGIQRCTKKLAQNRPIKSFL